MRAEEAGADAGAAAAAAAALCHACGELDAVEGEACVSGAGGCCAGCAAEDECGACDVFEDEDEAEQVDVGGGEGADGGVGTGAGAGAGARARICRKMPDEKPRKAQHCPCGNDSCGSGLCRNMADGELRQKHVCRCGGEGCGSGVAAVAAGRAARARG